MKKIFKLLLTLVLIISLAGCSQEWRKKFVRKKKETKKPRIYQVKKYKKAPTRELYEKHYNYAVTWLSELTGRLGENRKKDIRCIGEAISQVRDMQTCLMPEKASELDKHINRLKEVQSTIINEDLTQSNKYFVMRNIEREERFLRSEFYYDKIQKFMKTSFEDEEFDSENNS